MDRIALSKKLSYLLRHHPEDADIVLDNRGFTTCELSELASRLDCKVQEIIEVVKNDKKQRFTIEKNRIRANYGHSIYPGDNFFTKENTAKEEDLPDILYHGTIKKNIKSIKENGLLPQGRKFVHHSYTKDTARNVGRRHGSNVIILKIDVTRCLHNNIKFWICGPEIVVSDPIPSAYIEF